MTVPSSVNRSGPYSGNGVATVFDYDFRIVSATHLTVVRTVDGVDTIVSTSDYAVTGVGADNGTIVFTLAPAIGQSITIIRNVPFTQETDLENQGAYYAETVEAAFDLAVMRDQQLEERLDRAVQIPVGADPSTLPGLIENVLRLADSVDNIDTVADNIDAVNELAPYAQTIAENVSDITNFADVYQGPKASDPTTRNDGSALQSGDLYFNTNVNQLRVYNGSSWVDAGALAINLVPNSFTGNGSQTAFTLSASPVLPQNVLVWVGGVRQRPTVDYTVGGSTLTLLTAPGNGVAVDTLVLLSTSTIDVPANGTTQWPVSTVAELKALPVSRGCALLTQDGRCGTFVWRNGDFSAAIALDVRNGIYAKSNDVAANLGSWVRQFDGPAFPEWFRNVVDADDTASIQAAVDVAKYVELKSGKNYTVSPNPSFPGVTGTYTSGSVCINVVPSAKIVGFGKLTLAAGSAGGSGAIIGNPLNPSSSNDVVLRDFTIDGNDANVPGIYSGVNILNSIGGLIENLTVYDTSAMGIGVRTELVLDIDGTPPDNTVPPTRYGATSVIIRGNKVSRVGIIGIQVSCPDGLIVSDNHITDCGDNGIDVFGNDPAGSFNFGRDVVISNNTIKNSLNGICIESFFKWIISNNIISDCRDTAMWINSINTKGNYGTIISNFMYKGTGTGLDGIRFQSGAGRCIVSGNYFHGFDNAFDINSGGVGVQISENHYASLGKYVLRVPQAVNAAISVMMSGTQFVEANGVDANGFPQLHSPTDCQVPSRYSQFQVLGNLYSFLGVVPRNFVKPGTWSIVPNAGWSGAKAIYNVGGDGKTRVQFAGSPIPSINNYLRTAGAIYAIMGDAGGSALFVAKWNGSAFVYGDFTADFAPLTGPNDAPEKYAIWWTQ